MKKIILFFSSLVVLPILLSATNYGSFSQVTEINFEDGSSTDVLNNVSSTLLNGATVVVDTERESKVLQFSATTKSCLQLNTSVLSDTLTIAFWGKREDMDPTAPWRMFLALYANDGSNIYLTPKTSWNANSYLILESKPFANYRPLQGTSIDNEKWYHFAITFLDNSVKLYVNGVLQSESTSLFKLSDFKMTKFFFGNNPELNYSMTGRVDDIKMYHYALYENQIKALYLGQELPPPPIPEIPTSAIINCRANTQETYQTIQNFGASDGWSAQPIGNYFPENKKEHMAELLFSRDTLSDGTPKGIGLSSWRFNIGAGTSEQGNASRISHYSRRTECFLNPDKSTYNWNKQAGQRWFLEKAAKTYQVPDIIGWQNSPPVYYTVRGLGFREFGDTKSTILKRENYGAFGKFLADVVTHFKSEGIHFKYISPLNEPQWDWNATAAGAQVAQEGTPWMNPEIWETIKAINGAFVENEVDTKLFLTEAASINYLLNEGTGYYSKQLYDFWDHTSIYSLAGLPSFSNHVSSHSYWTDASAIDIVTRRRRLRDQIQTLNPNLDYWQTEYCLLGDGYKFGHANGAARTLSPMECGISLARIIHNDLTEGNCSAWQWWTTFEFDSKAGAEERFALVRFELNSAQNDGVFRTTKLLYTLGNYSRFVRPGMKRIAVQRSDAMDAFSAVTKQMFSAYTDGEEVVIVAVNASPEAAVVDLGLSGLQDSVSEWIPYVTGNDPHDNLKRYPSVAAGSTFLLPGTSVVTFVGQIEHANSALKNVRVPVCSVYPNPAKETVSVTSENRIRKIKINTISGKRLLEDTCNDYQYTIPVKQFPAGVYFITVDTDNGTFVQKLLVR